MIEFLRNSKKMLFTYFLFLLLENCFTQSYDTRPTVILPQGTLIGVKVYTDVSRTAVNSFLGVPYAEPPEGRLRFAIPEKHRGWNGSFYANNYGAVCPFRATSIGINEKEDCLYLNIWTPEDLYNRNNLPVIVFLESEQIIGSHPSLVRIPGHDLAAEGAVVVSVSYRQNIFGFFCLGTHDARGNLGLLDQYLALLWIKENISKFGGDPQLVTILGHSSSAVMVLYHIASPRTFGLFSKAIIMSGSAVAPWYTKDPITISNKLTVDLGCLYPSTKSTLECLRTKSVQEILRYFDRHTEDEFWYKSTMPIIDTFLSESERYLPSSLETVFQNGNFTIVPILTGITDFLSNAEQWRWRDLNQDYNQLKQYAEESVIPNLLHKYGFDTNKDIIKHILRWKYLNNNNQDAGILAEKIHNLQWDARIAAPHYKQLILLTNSTRPPPIYNYILHQFSTLANISTTSTIGGDLLLLFGPVLLQQIARRRFNVAEDSLSKYLKQLWINFARRGIPTQNGYQDNWQIYSKNNKFVQYLGNGQWNLNDLDSNVELWNKLFPKINSVTSSMNTIPKELQYSPDPAAGFRNAMYTLVGIVIALLALLLVCVVLLKKRAKERTRHMGF